jgi:ribonuclease HI
MSSNSNKPTKPNLSITIPLSSAKYMPTLGTPSPKHNYSNLNISKKNEYTLNFDGASRGNPGPAGIGAVIFENGQEIWASCQYIGIKTNNQSEYSALILGLKEALSKGIKCLQVYGDSQLVINQINGQYKVKNPGLQELYQEVQQLKSQFDNIIFTHVYREFNKRADHLSNMALDVLDVNEDNGKSGLMLPSLKIADNEKEKEKISSKKLSPNKKNQIEDLLFPDI